MTGSIDLEAVRRDTPGVEQRIHLNNAARATNWRSSRTPPAPHAATWTARDQYQLRAGARRFENWETNFAGKVGLGVAIDYALAIGIWYAETSSTRIDMEQRGLSALMRASVHYYNSEDELERFVDVLCDESATARPA